MFGIVYLKNRSLLCKNPFSSYPRYGFMPSFDTQFSNQFRKLEINIGRKRYSSKTLNTKYTDQPEGPIYPLDVLRLDISKALHDISGIDHSLILNALESTNSMDRGDLLLPLPKIKVADPVAVANRWAIELSTHGCIGKVSAKGPFLQFFLDQRYLIQSTVPNILLQKGKYGQKKSRHQKKVVVEFSSPNIAKPFHAGHLRSTIIGGFLSNLYEAMGWSVTRMNYLGDWGRQFGLLAVGFKRYSDEKTLQKQPIQHLFDVYVKINMDLAKEEINGNSKCGISGEARSFFKNLENGDENAIKIWNRFRSLSIHHYIQTYSRLNINFDIFSGESQVSKESMNEALDIFRKNNLVKEIDGALVIDLTQWSKRLGRVVVQKSDGTTLYLTRDVGAAIERKKNLHFDKMVYVISSQQDLYMSQFFMILKKMNFEWAKDLQHINFGMVQGMSTRKGNVVFLDTILDEARDKALQIMENNKMKISQVDNPQRVADLIGVSAIIIQDMKSKRINNYEFNWNRMLSFEGDTGPYLQYTHSRLRSLERTSSDFTTDMLIRADFSNLNEPQLVELVRLLAQYPDVLRRAFETQEPATIVTYLFKVCHQVSSCYKKIWVSGKPADIAIPRLAVYSASRQVLHNAMSLLGLVPVDRM
ncbi:AEL_collapsed_G0024770.mRNA.1.CDS.1 [Saccharomyces cerevisiae]|nr:AEL_HP2_G0022550.mRNA.1.CDS.1 [Saccharomyces cerevisiae]CAI6490581.1 AEL_HP1_G0024370.mRNA.1.CDS.1 [Saccharomyces cerevisiae]CAI6528727.1 AEL_HP2_G0022550.mRNA.1.CDS.1 [Saccharomyces cerevisiae]CAI6696363.1 AEL_collapsed_G0024770.mRNA.1.CDS.1 [Saccharomyces cerevisiae]